MSIPRLPSYTGLTRSPAYTVEPQRHEQRLALSQTVRSRPSGQFIKESKSRGARLRLSAQEDNVDLPVYGSGSSVEGVVEISRPEGLTSVEVKIEGRLKLHEIAAGGMTSVKLCNEIVLLWVRDPTSASTCPSALDFRLDLPLTFVHDNTTYPLPPTYNVELDGLPGFTASIDYSVTATLVKPNPVTASLSLFGRTLGHIVVSTPFVHYPRSRPAVPIPSPLRLTRHGFIPHTDWQSFDSVIRAMASNMDDIHTKLYVPSSLTFCGSQPIPFHLALESSAHSLAAFLPYGPTSNITGKRATRIQAMRQTTVDVRHAMVSTTKADMWRVDHIGEASLSHSGDGPTWVAFKGEIRINEDVTVPAFKAGGLAVRDCILFTFTPTDPSRSVFAPLRQIVPARLTTDEWAADGTGLGVNPRVQPFDYAIPEFGEEGME